MEPALLELYSEGTPDDEVAVILRMADPLLPLDGVRVVARFGNIATVRVRRGDIPGVWSQTPVLSMKAAKLYGPTPTFDDSDSSALPEAAEDLEVRPSDLRRPEGDLPTGEGVLVAHIDWGLDFAHPDFRHPDGRTRLLALWDQSAPFDPAAPNRYGYGRIYSAAEIDRALAADDPYAALGYCLAPSDSGHGCHGTHCMGISAGNGRSGGPMGLAPEAGLMFVHFSTATAEGPSQLGDSVAFLEALKFFEQLAGDRPFVVNASLGRQAGQHDGKTLTEQGMDAFLLAGNGRCLSQSFGNYFDRGIHATGVLRPGQTRTLGLIVAGGGILPNEVDLWYPGIDRFGVILRAPEGGPEVRAEPGKRVQVTLHGRKVGNLYHRIGDPNNGDNEVTLFLDPTAPAGRWELILIGQDIANGRFHAWVERTASRAPPYAFR